MIVLLPKAIGVGGILFNLAQANENAAFLADLF
jgi:hypothetical protein